MATKADRSMQLLDADQVDFRFDFEASVSKAPEAPAYLEATPCGSPPASSISGSEDSTEEIIQCTSGTLLACGMNLTHIPADLAIRFGTNVHTLDFSHNLLCELEHISAFTDVTTLNLDFNFINETTKFPSFPNLHTLLLNKNRISDIDAFLTTIKTQYPKLTYLSLHGNQACPNELVEKDEEDYQRYRYYVISKLPNLRFLDSRAISSEERKTAQVSGKFMKVVRFSQSDLEHEKSTKQDPTPFTPLDKTTRPVDQTRATVGTSRYVYYGKHSEGNRFIRDDDL